MTLQPKTGVLTFHRCINYGSYWQARCLLDGLLSRGCRAVLLDHQSPRVNRAEWQCALRPVLPAAVPKWDYPRYGAKILRFVHAFSKLPRSARFPLEDPSKLGKFDLVIVGSDEVWNLFHPWYGGCPVFFGEKLQTQRLVAHAASFGNYDAARGLDEVWVERLRRFDSISVRDENSRRIVGSALGVVPEVVLDPCLQFPPKLEGGSDRLTGNGFVAVYGHNFSDSFVREVMRWAASRRLPTLSLGYRNAWADRQWLEAGPRGFVQAIANASAVVTNFFHGCVFALGYGKPFVCEGSPYRSTKVRDLMELVGAARHLLGEPVPAGVCDSILRDAVDPAVLDRIHDLRRSSDASLLRALK